MFKLLPILILGMIAAEIIVFVAAVQFFGGLAVLAATLATAVAGGLLLRRQGLKALASLGSRPGGRPTTYEAIVRGTWLALAGLLLIFPGFIADALGILLIIRPVQKALTKRAGQWFAARPSPHATRPGWSENGPVIEGEAVEVTSEPDGKPPLIR